MRTTICPYDLCRRYITDYRPQLGEEFYKVVDGNLRSRNLPNLAAVTSLLDNSTLYSVDQRRILMQVEAFFKKNASLPARVNTKRAALKNFSIAESICRDTNERLSLWYLRPEEDSEYLVKRAQRYISRVLGPFDVFLEGLPKRIRVTSGASATRARKNSLPYMKLRSRIPCTHGASPLVSALAKFFGYRPNLSLTTSNRVITVPKSWKTERTIACEPEGNLPLQLAFDTYVKQRLNKRGIDLSDQTRNQELAKQGSLEDNLSTIDLSMASDTLSRSVVALLLPKEWYDYLESVRSPQYTVGKSSRLHTYEKFSSMGNGATFVLETLVFASLAYAAGSSVISVYGDDIIVDRESTEVLMQMLDFCGFVVNEEKSFSSGPFRESCGKHWMNGIDVTPMFFRTTGQSKADLCLLVNNIMQIGYPGSKVWELAKDVIIQAKLPFVPFNQSPTSGVFIDVPSAYQQKLIRNRLGKHNQVVSFKAYVNRDAHKRVHDSRTYILWFLYKLYNSDVRKHDIPVETSRVPLLQHKYVRKWVVFFPEDIRRTPVQLYSWTDYLLSP